MGVLTTTPYTLEDGEDFVAYLTHVTQECDRLQAEGRIPSDEGISDFLDILKTLASQVRNDVARGRATGEQQLRTGLALTAAEYARTRSMTDSLRPLLEILELRDAVDLRRTAGAMRVASAVLEGTFTD
ncbi:MAG: hypothetical protein JWO22_188 [Frankiales bacterium]|nr:hypothetical protein [Frankiales bacterium]